MAELLLIPGLWLDAASWDAVAPHLEAAGHRVHALTLPGLGAPADASGGIGIEDWVDAVVERIDAAGDPVTLVGHSGGGNVAWGAADRRADRVRLVVLVDTLPPPDGAVVSEFPIVDGVVPFPGWESFGEEDVFDLDGPTRERAAAAALSVPGRVPTDPLRLSHERRFRVPVHVLSGSADEAGVRGMLAEWPGWAAEFEAIEDVAVTRLGTGHWPQFSQPLRLARAIDDAVRGQ